MKFQRQPTASFGPRQCSSLKKKPPGQRMMKIRNEVRRRQAYMPSSAPYRNTSASRSDDVENIGCARNGKSNGPSKSVHANQRGGNVVAPKSRKTPLGEISNRNIVPLGKRPKPVRLEKSMPSSLMVDFSSEGVEKISLQALKDNSSDTDNLSRKPSRKEVSSSRGLTSLVEAPLVPSKLKVMQGNDVAKRVKFVDGDRKEESFKENEHKNTPSKGKGILETEDSRDNSDAHRWIETSCLRNNMKDRSGGPPVEDRRTDKVNCKSKRKGPGEHGNGIDGTNTIKVVKGSFLCIEDGDGDNNKTVKRARRNYICQDEDEEDISGDEQNIISGDGQNTVGIEDGTNGLIAQAANVELYGSLPIDEPIWSGMLKIGSEGYVPLEAHLLAKSCEKVWECSRSLRNMVQVTKHSRVRVEPKCFRVSSPTEDNIGLYFFPQGMRPNEDFDKLVKEVMDNDLILRATVGEAEMLIFPSIVLPERHQTFQGKHYLWGLFKRRDDEVYVDEEHMQGACLFGHEEENGQQRCSRGSVDQEGIGQERSAPSLARSTVSTRTPERAAADIAIPAPTALAVTSHAPNTASQSERAAAQAATRPALAATSHVPSSTRPAEGTAGEAATPAPASTAAMSHAPSSAVLGGGVIGFIIQRPNQRTEQILQDLKREGAVVLAMRGEMVDYGLGRQ